MPTTPVFALPFPAPADPANVPADLQALATKLDTLLGRTELAYGEITAGGALSTTQADIVAAPAITLPGVTALLVEFVVPVCSIGTPAGTYVQFNLFDGGTDLGLIAQMNNPGSASHDFPVSARRRIAAAAAGSRAYKVRGKTSAGAGGVNPTPTSPVWIRVSRA